MAAESIEDMSIDLVKMNNQQVKSFVQFPIKGQSDAQDAKLAEALDPEVYQVLDENESII